MRTAMNVHAAAEAAAVDLARIISIYRHYRTTNLDQVDSMKG
jgi:NADH:ubiquinone oxidoreductase subunit K